MNDNEASQFREAVILHPFTDTKVTYKGDAVYSVTDKGIVIAEMSNRILYPWQRVAQFTYHSQDIASRKAIQGW